MQLSCVMKRQVISQGAALPVNVFVFPLLCPVHCCLTYSFYIGSLIHKAARDGMLNNGVRNS
jgi:hypothetical protein